MFLFKKKKRNWKPNKKNYLIDFSTYHVSTDTVCNLLYYLYKKYGFIHITYTYKSGRFILSYHTDNPDSMIKQFFADRTPAQIEELCISLKKIKIEQYTCEEYADGFIEYKVYYWKEIMDECEKKES